MSNGSSKIRPRKEKCEDRNFMRFLNTQRPVLRDHDPKPDPKISKQQQISALTGHQNSAKEVMEPQPLETLWTPDQVLIFFKVQKLSMSDVSYKQYMYVMRSSAVEGNIPSWSCFWNEVFWENIRERCDLLGGVYWKNESDTGGE